MFRGTVFFVFIGLLNYVNGQNCNSGKVPGRCNCISNVISCEGRQLTSVPTFRETVTAEVLNLMSNNITSISPNAFTNVKVKTINLGGNFIRTIDNGAFNGVKMTLTTLILNDNKLNTLPDEFSNLEHLVSLDVRKNPIVDTKFTDTVMKALGDTIEDFRFGSLQLDKWPQSISHFQELKSLELDTASSRLRIIPPVAFHSFRTTINEMTIKNTDLLAVPIAVSSLRNLHTFHFDHNHKVGDQGVLVQSFVNNHTSLHTLSLIDDRLTRFPRVLRYLNHLKNLTLDSNTLDFVNDEAIGLLGNVKILSLQNCSLERVPGALSDLPGLTHLDLSDNVIKSIERNDLGNLYSLRNLSFHNNPLTYVSNDTFTDLHALLQLDLTNTKLTLVPEALRNIYGYMNHCLDQVTIFENKLDCMCELVWLKNLQNSCPHMKLKGDCDTINVNLDTYIKTFIPRCPAWLLQVGGTIYPYHLPGK